MFRSCCHYDCILCRNVVLGVAIILRTLLTGWDALHRWATMKMVHYKCHFINCILQVSGHDSHACLRSDTPAVFFMDEVRKNVQCCTKVTIFLSVNRIRTRDTHHYDIQFGFMQFDFHGIICSLNRKSMKIHFVNSQALISNREYLILDSATLSLLNFRTEHNQSLVNR